MVEEHVGGIQSAYDVYVCPGCKDPLEYKSEALHCHRCGNAYPVLDGIPDFITEDLIQSDNPTLKGVKSIDRLAGIYESWIWYPVVLGLFGGLKSPTLLEMVQMIEEMLEDTQGFILDVACGPGTYGRRIKNPERTVYGIDISMGMLRQGLEYVERDNLSDVHFSRALVEGLPFRADQFDAVLCGGALHLFEDTVRALKEVGRTMKRGATLAVMTFGAGDGGILKYRWIRQHVRKDHAATIFELPELEGYLQEAGFEDFDPQLFGSSLVFSARKKGVRT